MQFFRNIEIAMTMLNCFQSHGCVLKSLPQILSSSTGLGTPWHLCSHWGDGREQGVNVWGCDSAVSNHTPHPSFSFQIIHMPFPQAYPRSECASAVNILLSRGEFRLKSGQLGQQLVWLLDKGQLRSFEVVLMLELSLWLGLVCVVGLTVVIGIEKGLEITRRGFKP